MRSVLAVVLLSGGFSAGGFGAGCFSAGSITGSGSTRPGVMPMLSELPSDPAKRDAILDSSVNVAGPEQRQGMTVKERKAETAAATAAAIIGSLLSNTQNVTLGTATVFDESALAPLPAPRPAGSDHPDDPANPPAPGESNKDLIPWLKLK
jgi:hypothetical protein